MTLRPGPRWWLLIALLTLAAGGLRGYGLGHRHFWFDESCTFLYVHDLFDWPAGSSLLAESTNLPYYLLLRGWTALFGESEAAFRWLSALAATLTVPLLAMLACQFAGARCGAVAAALAALNPLHIYYAHEARAYAVWVLLLTLALTLLVRAVRAAGRGWWWGFGVVLWVCLCTHYFTIYLVPATLAAVLLAEKRVAALRRWALTVALVALAFAPYALAAVVPAARGGGSAWIAETFEPWASVPRTLWAFLPAGAYPAHLRGLSVASPDTVLLAGAKLTALSELVPVLMFLAMTAVLLVRRRQGNASAVESAGAGRVSLVLAVLTLGPLLAAWCYSLLVRPVYLVGRYDMVAWPAAVVLQALAVSSFAERAPRARRGLAAAVVCVPLLLCSLLPVARLLPAQPPPSRAHLRAERLAALCGPGDLVIAFSYDRDYLRYDLHRAGFRGRIVSFPSWLELQLGWVDTRSDLSPERMARLPEDAQALLGIIHDVLARDGRVWLLADSMDRAGSAYDRRPINGALLQALRDAGFEFGLADEARMIFYLARRPAAD
ncbi:MAG: glycosyltransferase family 39 protein [Planctomycetes bacterium]|nr:glycosyltransferase family 39 protein [Planctomycetota bacterium]